jgi:hypothetical protein
MDNVSRLVSKVTQKGFRIQIRFDPEEKGEEWEVKLYPEYDDDAHFYAYAKDLNQACRKLLDEVDEELGAW